MMRIAPYLALAGRALEANFRRLSHPYKLTFCLTFWCNYRCETCNIWKMKPRDELRLDEIQRFFRQSPGFLWVDLTGGEVSLRKDFVDICEAVVSSCPHLLLLHFETFRRLREMPGVDVVLGMTLSAKNVDHFPQAFAAARREIPDLAYGDFHVNIVHESSHYLGNTELGLRSRVGAEALARATEGYAQLRGRARSPVDFLERAYLKRVRRYVETGATPMRCHALRASCFVDSWGNVFPCTVYDRRIGNLREVDYDLARIWNTPAAATLQAEIWESRCPNCWTPCEAYQSILGNLVRPELPRFRRSRPRPVVGSA
ncbi:MAG: hypothetical protein E6J81_06390 [Deltaproteobacteria bacterium]|nr:MAG: hypothetical protein E6J81_06390 [Deltaproteobacteria bacterium]